MEVKDLTFERDSHQSQKGTTAGYQVQVRYNYHEPITIGGEVYGLQWKTLDWQLTKKAGIPLPKSSYHDPATFHLLPRTQAQALKYWFLSFVQSTHHSYFCIETRIIEFKVDYSYEWRDPEVVELCTPVADEEEDKEMAARMRGD